MLIIFLILATILKVFHLKFIQCSWWTSCCFHVELLWHIFVCTFLIHSSVLPKWYSFDTNLSHNNFLTFSDQGLELITTTKIGPWLLIHFCHIKHTPCSRWTFSIFVVWIFYFLLKSNCSQIITELLSWIERIILKCKKQFLFCVLEHGNTRWTSLARIFELPRTELLNLFQQTF